MDIIIDVDDTILNLVDAWLNIYNKQNDDNIKKEQIISWNIGDYTKIKDDFYQYLSLPDYNLYDYCNPIEHSLEVIKFLKSTIHRITYVTASDYMNRKYHFLEKLGYLEKPREYIVAYDKSMICADVIIDDKYEYVINSKATIKILFDQPWNRSHNFPDRYYPGSARNHRVKNWIEIKKLFGG